MDNIETSQNQNMVAAETIGFRFEADLFKSVQIIIVFCWDVSHSNRLLQKPLVSYSKQTYLNQYRLSMALVVIDNIETFHNKKIVLQKPLVSYLKQTFSNQHRSSSALAFMDNIETFHNEKNVVAETVGFRLEADLFKSVQIIQGFCCHGQHCDVSP